MVFSDLVFCKRPVRWVAKASVRICGLDVC